MKWKASQQCIVNTPEGKKLPSGSLWNFDSDSVLPMMVSASCPTHDFFTNLSHIEYIEFFGEDRHIWKVIQKADPQSKNSLSTMVTKIGQLWTVVDLGDGVKAHCLTKATVQRDKKAVNEHKSISFLLSYPQYIDLFGEDERVNKKAVVEKRFDL
ncbi:MAG TPA: hypothetical protein PLE74_06225 [Candidatus Cloacimonadota bacterium]|nr:hypothetical protein [Candidatus Cloacimonadota bacterium]